MAAPSHLMLLEQLHTAAPGIKVRFLGCVHEYHGSNGRLLLRNQYPTTTTDVPTALVNIDNVLSSNQRDLLEVGAWLNVIGSVERPSRPRVTGPTENTQTVVTATMIWSAGAIKLENYEAAVKDYQKHLGTK